MRKPASWCAILLLALALGVLGLAAPPALGQDVNGAGLHIQRPAGASDGYNGGLRVTRDASQAAGGTLGHVNTAAYFYCIAGRNVTAFEWCDLAVLDNYAIGGENVVRYNQARKRSTGPTWAAVDEVIDTTNLPGALVGREIDIFAAGPAGPDRVRIGLDLVVGDPRIRYGMPTDYVAEGMYGVRVAALIDQPWAKWRYGVYLGSFTHAGVVMDSDATRALWLRGKYAVGVDLGDAQAATAVRLRAGQRITFDQYDQVGISEQGGLLVIDNAGRRLFVLNVATGDLHIAGKIFQGAP